MNKVFASKLPDGSTGLSDPEVPGMQSVAFARAPGTIPPHVNPPKPNIAPTSASLFASSDEPVVAVSPTRVASASSDGGFFSNLAKKVGIGGGSETTATTTTTQTPVPAKPKVIQASKPVAPAAKPALTSADAKVATATPRPPLKPTVSADQPVSSGGASLAGAAAVVPANSFDSRFSAVR
jgi:hypothetical protein